MTWPRIPVVLVVVAMLAGACDIQTAGTPGGGTRLTASFDTLRNLVPGHAVRVADIQIGTVTAIELNLETFQGEVTLDIEKGRRIPVGTSALLRKTSLLGENYVALVYPEDFDAVRGPWLDDGAHLGTGEVLPDVEQVADRAVEIVGALAVEDVSRLVDAAAEGLLGRGGGLNQLIGDLADVARVYAANGADLGRAIDGFAALGSDLAAGRDDLEALTDELTTFTASLADQRLRLIGTMHDLSRLARVLDETLLGDNAELFERALREFAPVARTIADSRDGLDELITNLLHFVSQIHKAIREEQIGVFGWIDLEATFDAAGAGSSAQEHELRRLLEPAP